MTKTLYVLLAIASSLILPLNGVQAEDEERAELLPLYSISFVTFEKVCKPMLSEKGIIAHEAAKNSVLIYDKNSVILKVKTILSQIDYEEVAEIIPLHSIDFKTAKRVCGPLLSESGAFTYMDYRNAIVVYDRKEIVNKVAERLAKLDKKVPNIKVSIEFIEKYEKKDRQISLDLNIPRNRGIISVENGKMKLPDLSQIDIDGNISKTTGSNEDSLFLVTKSGRSANLFAGQEQINPIQLNEIFRKHKVAISDSGKVIVMTSEVPDVQMREIGSALKILPKAMDNGMVEVEIYPEISFIDKNGDRHAVGIKRLGTVLVLKEGERINAGQVIKNDENDYFKLFGPTVFGKSSNSNLLNMFVSVKQM